MNATELRKGNNVLLDGNEHIITVYDLVSIDKKMTGNYEPVIATENHFVRFGFIKNGLFLTKKYLSFEILVISMRDRIFVEIASGGIKFQLPCQYEYVHEIQNLIFLLTGEELIYQN